MENDCSDFHVKFKRFLSIKPTSEHETDVLTLEIELFDRRKCLVTCTIRGSEIKWTGLPQNVLSNMKVRKLDEEIKK